MSSTTIGILGIVVVVIVFFIIRMPIAFSMAFVGFLGFSFVSSFKTGLSVLPREIFEQLTSCYSISAIPMFILMGFYAFSAGLGTRLYEAAYKILGPIRGGLAIASIFACACWRHLVPQRQLQQQVRASPGNTMKKHGYDDTLSTGCIASAGTLGILIPPSVIFLIYGFMTEQSIGKLFISGIVPGIILAFFMSAAVYLMCLKNPSYGPKGPKSSLKEMVWALVKVVDVLLLFIVVIGGLLYGFFTPTQAGGAGAAGALIIGLVRRELSWKIFIDNTIEALRTSCMILTIIACASVFGKFMTMARIPSALSSWVGGLEIPTFLTMFIIIAIYLVGGAFSRRHTLNHPHYPHSLSHCCLLGYDPIWFGVIIVLVTCMGVITPPVGVNVYVIKGIATDVPLEKIFKGIFPFLLAIIITTILMIFVPSLTLILPNLAVM